MPSAAELHSGLNMPVIVHAVTFMAIHHFADESCLYQAQSSNAHKSVMHGNLHRI